MHYSLRKIAAGTLLLAAIAFMLSYAAFAAYDINILVNGEKIECFQSPIIKNGEVFVPMKEVFEALEAEIYWDETSRSISVGLGESMLTVFPENGKVLKDGVKLGADAITENGGIMIPLHIVAESMGYNVIWNGDTYTVSISTAPLLTVNVLDCGQADCIFIELSDGKCMLIDAAEKDFGKVLEGYIRNLGYSHIDYVVASHPHSDHIGGMAHILKSFSVGVFYMPDVAHTTKSYANMIDALKTNGCSVKYLSQGFFIEDGDYDISVLSPDLREYARMNDYSAVIKLVYNSVSMLFSADAEEEAEKTMVESNIDLDADILKTGHHGSATSTTEKYLDSVNPRDAIISVGKDNPYGYPDDYVTERLEKQGINIHRTDKEGNIKVTTDGYIYVIEGDR